MVKFAANRKFHDEVDRRVLAYFESTGRSQKANAAMVVKTGVLLAWFALSYVLLVFVAATWWQGLLGSLSLAMAMAGVGFSVQHDANHGAYSKNSAVNRGMGLTLDLLGASSYLWRFKHNVAHHTFTNLAGADDDINLAPFARVAPSQRHRVFHRAQHFYLWALYGFLMFKWHLVYDFKNLARGWVARSKFPRPKGWSLVELVAGKLVFVGWAVVLPARLPRVVGRARLLRSHVLRARHPPERRLPSSPTASRRRTFRTFPWVRSGMPVSWAEHQVQTTADSPPRNRLLTWYVGGLNFQIEHHLFPRMCHVHYRRLPRSCRASAASWGAVHIALDPWARTRFPRSLAPSAWGGPRDPSSAPMGVGSTGEPGCSPPAIGSGAWTASMGRFGTTLADPLTAMPQ
jgi:linoleoyl-CoA desaturase